MPSAAEVAERIKALKARQTVGPVPVRIGSRRVSAEEPVTARIRRSKRSVAIAEAELTSEPEAVDSQLPEPREASVISPLPDASLNVQPAPQPQTPKPNQPFRHRAAVRENSRHRQLSLF